MSKERQSEDNKEEGDKEDKEREKELTKHVENNCLLKKFKNLKKYKRDFRLRKSVNSF